MYEKLLSRNVATVVIYLTLTPQSGTQYHHHLHAGFNNTGEIQQFPMGSLNILQKKKQCKHANFDISEAAYLQRYRRIKNMQFEHMQSLCKDAHSSLALAIV